MKDWGESVSELRIKRKSYKKLYTVYFTWVFLTFVRVFKFVSCVLLLVLSCVLCDCCWLAVCVVFGCFVYVLQSYVYLFSFFF